MFHSNAWLPLHPDVSEVEIDLINKELWRKFSRLNHEMKVTPDGRFVLFIHNYNYNMRESMSHIHVAKTLLQVTTWWASCKWGSLSSLQLRWVSYPTPAFSLSLMIFHIILPFFFSGVDVAYKPASKINSNGVILIITVFYQVSSMPMISIFSK